MCYSWVGRLVCGYRHTETADEEHTMPAKKPLRSQVQVPIRFDPSVADRLRNNAQELGLSVSEYLAALVMGQTPVARPAAGMSEIGLASNRLVRSIGLLDAEEVDLVAMRRLLSDASRFLHEELLKAVPPYNAAIVAQGKDDIWGDLDSSMES